MGRIRTACSKILVTEIVLQENPKYLHSLTLLPNVENRDSLWWPFLLTLRFSAVFHLSRWGTVNTQFFFKYLHFLPSKLKNGKNVFKTYTYASHHVMDYGIFFFLCRMPLSWMPLFQHLHHDLILEALFILLGRSLL